MSRTRLDLSAAAGLDEGSLPEQLAIRPVAGPVHFTVRPPGSKSLTNRALLLAALATGKSTLRGALVDADDAQVMIAALRQLGAGIEVTSDHNALSTITVDGVGGSWKLATGQSLTLKLNNAGTATRFLTAAALLAASGSSIIIDGNARMRQRPIGDLVDALNQLTAPHRCASYLTASGYPPVRIEPPPPGLLNGRRVEFGPLQSSQFVSAVMLVAAAVPGGLTVGFRNAAGHESITSESYIRMTLGLLQRLGVSMLGTPPADVHIGATNTALAAFDYPVEADASGASYFVAIASIIPGSTATIEGVPADSLQGDAALATLLAATTQRGLPIDADFSDMPDVAMTAAVAAAFVPPVLPGGPCPTSTLRGLKTLRVKETDRIAALQTELAKIGVKVTAFADGDDEAITVTPPTGGIDCSPSVGEVEFDTYDDHRMAMSLALIGLRRQRVIINDPRCVGKTYRTFWRDLARATGLS